MATRQEIQIAQDLIRFVNIVNDLMDVTAYMMQEIDAQTGGPLQIEEEGIFRSLTFKELKDRVVRACQNVQGYKIMIMDFLDSADQAMIVSGLGVLGVDLLTFKNELLAMNTVRDYVAGQLSLMDAKVDLVILGQYIDANVPKLTLVRRSWCLGMVDGY